MFEIERAFTFLGNEEYEKAEYRLRTIYQPEPEKSGLWVDEWGGYEYDTYFNMDGEENVYYIEYKLEGDKHWKLESEKKGYGDTMAYLKRDLLYILAGIGSVWVIYHAAIWLGERFGGG